MISHTFGKWSRHIVIQFHNLLLICVSRWYRNEVRLAYFLAYSDWRKNSLIFV